MSGCPAGHAQCHCVPTHIQQGSQIFNEQQQQKKSIIQKIQHKIRNIFTVNI
jgi:hypothetical protein